MGRKAQVQRSPEEKFAIVIEGLKSGNIAETCRTHNIAPTLYYRWKDEAETAAVAALGGGAQPVQEQTMSYDSTCGIRGQVTYRCTTMTEFPVSHIRSLDRKSVV